MAGGKVGEWVMFIVAVFLLILFIDGEHRDQARQEQAIHRESHRLERTGQFFQLLGALTPQSLQRDPPHHERKKH